MIFLFLLKLLQLQKASVISFSFVVLIYEKKIVAFTRYQMLVYVRIPLLSILLLRLLNASFSHQFYLIIFNWWCLNDSSLRFIQADLHTFVI